MLFCMCSVFIFSCCEVTNFVFPLVSNIPGQFSVASERLRGNRCCVNHIPRIFSYLYFPFERKNRGQLSLYGMFFCVCFLKMPRDYLLSLSYFYYGRECSFLHGMTSKLLQLLRKVDKGHIVKIPITLDSSYKPLVCLFFNPLMQRPLKTHIKFQQRSSSPGPYIKNFSNVLPPYLVDKHKFSICEL